MTWLTPTAIGKNVSDQKRRKSAAGGFTCCVPVYFSNSNWNHALLCNSFLYRQSNVKRLLGKKCL